MHTCFHSQLALKILNGIYCCSGLLSLCVPFKIAIFPKKRMLVITLAFTSNSYIFRYISTTKCFNWELSHIKLEFHYRKLWLYSVVQCKYCKAFVKVSLFGNVFGISSILPKNERKNSTLLQWHLKSNCFRSFFGIIEDIKKTFRN